MERREAVLRYEALEHCLALVEALRRTFSKNGSGLVPLLGYEKAWAREDQIRETMQRMMRELRYDIKGGNEDACGTR